MIPFALFTWLCLSPTPTPDTWVAIGPSAYIALGGQYVAEVFTPTYRLNVHGHKALCYVYSATERADRSFKFSLLWKDSLLSYMPEKFFLTSDAYLIAVDREGFGAARSPALAIYDPRGHVVKSFDFDSFGEKYHRRPPGMSGMWYFRARFFYFGANRHFYALLESQDVMEFRVTDGSYRVGRLDEFPDLKDAIQRNDPNVELGRGSYGLYYSSITELEAARRGKLK
jgi:hypothetical protein